MLKVGTQADWIERAQAVLPAGGFGNFDPGIVIRDGQGARVRDEDGREILIPNLRLPDDAGGATPAQLIESWALGLRGVAKLEGEARERALRELVTRFGAFSATSPHPFLIPAGPWAENRGGAPRTPASGDLLLICEALVAGSPSGRATEIKVYSSAPPQPKPERVDVLAAWLGIRSQGSSQGNEVSGASIHGMVANSPAMAGRWARSANRR